MHQHYSIENTFSRRFPSHSVSGFLVDRKIIFFVYCWHHTNFMFAQDAPSGGRRLRRFNSWGNILMRTSMTLVLKEQWDLLAIKYREITLISPYKTRWCDMKIALIAPNKKKVKSFRDKIQGAIRPRLNYTKVYLFDTNRNNWKYGTFVKMSNDWNRSTLRIK